MKTKPNRNTNNMHALIYFALLTLALGLVTSISVLSLYHILILLPALYLLPRTNFKCFSKSAWALFALSLALILSVLINQDIMVDGLRPLMKIKYFLIGFLSIAPIAYYMTRPQNEKRNKYLLYTFCFSTTFASVCGLIAMKLGHNPITHGSVDGIRNAGLFGMVMNYAHNLSYFLIIIFGLIVHHKKIENLISKNLLIFIFIVNSIGLFASYTRGAWLALLIGAPFYWYKKHIKIFALSALIMSLIGFCAYTGAGKSMLRKDNDMTRVGQWLGAMAAFKERPLLGVGYLNYEKICDQIKHRHNIIEPDFKGHAHNNFMEILADAGSLGILTFVLWIMFWVIEMHKREDFIAQLGLPFIVVFVVGGLTQSTIALGINLFFVMAFYSITQAGPLLLKEDFRVRESQGQ